MWTIIWTTTCSVKCNNWVLYTQWNLINNRESLLNNHRKIVRDKLQSRDYSWCKIRVVQRTSQW